MKRQLYLYLILLCLVVVTMIALYLAINRADKPHSTPRDYPEIVELGELHVVTDYNTIGYYVEGDSATGFQLEMMRALEKEWGVRVQLTLENSLEESLKGLQNHRYDLVARNIPVNAKLKDDVAFTTPITLNKQVLVQRKALYNDSIEPIRQQLQLAKKTIYVAKDSPAILRLSNLSHEIGDTIYIKEDPTYGPEQLVIMVASGDIDFTVCDEMLAIRLAKEFEEIDVVTDIGFTQFEAWAVRRDSPQLLDSLNGWLENFKKTRTFKSIYNHYYK